MAKSGKIGKSMTARSKGVIALVLLLVITLCVSYLAVSGIHYGEEGVMQLLPWVPVSSKNWPESLPLSRNLGGGVSFVLNASAAEGESLETALETSKVSVEKRLADLGETAYSVVVDGNALRVELPAKDSDLLHDWIEYVSVPGKFELRTMSGDAEVFAPAYVKPSLDVNSNNNGYQLTLEFSKEDTQKLNDYTAAYGSIHYAYCDGSQINSIARVNGGKVILDLSQDINTASNVAFWCSNPVTVDLTHDHGNEEKLPASSGALLSIVLIAAAVLLAAGLIYMFAAGKMTAVSGIITVWCAVMLACFFYATLVMTTVNIANLLMLLAGLVLALYAAILRTREIGNLIAEGNSPKSAAKVGLRAAAKKVWLAHGVLLAISLIMMIFAFSRAAGYALCCGVAASALVSPVMRAFQACFIAVCGKANCFGKVK